MTKSLINFLFKSNFDFKKAMKNYKYYSSIKESGLFDDVFYAETYDDVKGDSLTHYLLKGHKEGKLPSLDFDPDFYNNNYPDVQRANLNPLLHYIVHGKNEGKIFQYAYPIRRMEEICETNLAFLTNYEFEEEPLVSIIILTRNGLNHLKRLFADFDKKTNYSNYEIIVVDNASSDESVGYLKSLDLPITVIENKENVSFSKGNNDAAKIANGEYILLLNNDINPTYGWLNEMVGTIVNNENVASVGAKLVFPFYYDVGRDKSFKLQHTGDMFAERMYPCCLYAINKANNHLDIFDSSLTENNQCIAVTGAVNLINKEIYDELGGLDENYIYGLEDVDFSLKLHKKGYKTLLASNALLFHHESSTRVKTKNYVDNDKHNYRIFWSKWGNYLSKNLLLDKLHDNGFFTQKKLKITIIDGNHPQNSEFLSAISKEFNNLGFSVELISDLKNMYIGNSSDILLSLSAGYDLNNMIARKDIVKVFVANNNEHDSEGYDIVVSKKEGEYNSKYNFVITGNFVEEFLNKLEDILIKSDGFL
ncbi:glycosyltransferase family 2 protein [uncultured Methanobrevibacter sp.]|uniref:glycosyltransferase family 2 protein n=1 Tax=uncultured Methanobrevibacter sp. TaxID=253161 RepID=UPI002610268F|nr:glycosyltransferase family 2 protein [uncultured Methanobrevibacter sp.]